MARIRISLPHPIVLLLFCVLVAAIATWFLPAGEFERQVNPDTGTPIVIQGSYQQVEASPVGPLQALIAVPRGIVDGASVIAVILLVGGAFALLESTGALSRLIGTIISRVTNKKLIIVIVSMVFAIFGAIEGMQEEIIAMVPVLVLLSNRLGYGALTALSMSIGSAVVGSAFGPFNPFGTGLALQYAELPANSALGLRLTILLAAVFLWIVWTFRQTRYDKVENEQGHEDLETASTRDLIQIALVVLPFIPYVYGVLKLDWGFDELSALFLLSAYLIGWVAGLNLSETSVKFIKGMETMLAAALLVGVARGISVVLVDGNVLDTIIYGLALPLERLPPVMAGFLMVPIQILIHIPVPSYSGQAVLTIPVLAPVSDLLGLSRDVAVLAFQTGGILFDMITPTNGGVLAMLLAAKVPYMRWLSYALPGILLVSLTGFAGILLLSL